MSSQFQTGYKTNLYFYTFMGLIAVIMSICFKRLPISVLICFVVFFIGTATAFSITAKRTSKYTLYGKLQMSAFVVINIFLSVSFDSAQVFVYAMCFSTILGFVFIDKKVSQFQFVQCLICVVVAAAFVSIYTGSRQTMLAFTFGTIMLLVMNWVILSMTTHIRFQYRKNVEQERSLDDMLKVVEAKCDEARNATKTKSRFLAHMSHEIRTPINAVIGMNEMILRESTDRSILSYASETKNAADSLLSIINDILDITRIEAGKITPIYAEYKPAKLVNDIYNMIRFKAESKGLEFIVIADENIPRKLKGDDIRLKQILTNLLSNAVKYTHSGSVTLEIKHLGGGKLFFSVQDTGMGIRENDIEQIFVAFERMDEKLNRNIQGTGLGLNITSSLLNLNITSSLLKMFGSELKVTSEYGKGSVFSFDIAQEIIDSSPIGKIDLGDIEYSHTVYSAEFTAPEAKILVVDDNEMNRKVFKNLLKKTMVIISEAAGGAESVEMTKKEHFDIIFMDHMMPVMDGVQALEHIRNDEDSICRDVPVIALTANAIVGARDFYLNAGFDGFLSKPLDPKKLEKMLASALSPSLIDDMQNNTENSENIEFPVINGIDWNYARLHFENDKSMLETIDMFRRSVAKDTDELDGYYFNINSKKAVESYRIKVHGMKSTASLIGIVRLAGIAMELEEAARKENIDAIKVLHPVFIKSWKEYYSELGILFNKTDAVKKASEHREEILEIFENIRNAADKMDVDILDKMSQKLDEFIFDGTPAEFIEQVKNDIFNFNIEKLSNCTYD